MKSESDLYAPVKAFLEAQGYAVKGEVRGCDAVGVRGDEPPVVVELKRGFGLGLVLQSVDEVPTEKVKVAVLLAGTQRIELLEPTSPDSPIAVFLDKRGPGIHHLAFQVGDCQVKIDAMTALGAQMLNQKPNPGAHGCKGAFVHPKYLGGVLAEFVEDPHP